MNLEQSMKFIAGDFGVRHQAFDEDALHNYNVGTSEGAGNKHVNGWYRVTPNQKSSRNTSVIDTHGWSRTHIGTTGATSFDGIGELTLYAGAADGRRR